MSLGYDLSILVNVGPCHQVKLEIELRHGIAPEILGHDEFFEQIVECFSLRMEDEMNQRAGVGEGHVFEGFDRLLAEDRPGMSRLLLAEGDKGAEEIPILHDAPAAQVAPEKP